MTRPPASPFSAGAGPDTASPVGDHASRGDDAPVTFPPDLAAPRHIVVLPDGNRRWAQQHKVPLSTALLTSTKKILALADWCSQAGIEVLSLWGVSPANITRRSEAEMEAILRQATVTVTMLTAARRWPLRLIGDLTLLPQDLAERLATEVDSTADVEGMTINLAIGYDGRQDLLNAMRACVADGITPEHTTEHDLEARLSTHGQPAIDLVIRTSGERRLSGFMLWQLANAELYFSDTLWPDFTRDHFLAALHDYTQRERRLGA